MLPVADPPAIVWTVTSKADASIAPPSSTLTSAKPSLSFTSFRFGATSGRKLTFAPANGQMYDLVVTTVCNNYHGSIFQSERIL